jgi:retron-type reverse transcriptase
MKLKEADIIRIRTAFDEMQTKQDLLLLLNEAKPLVYGEKAVPFELKQLTWFANPKLGEKRYQEFKIKKKSGTYRTIHAPVRGLKSLQKTLSVILQCVFDPHPAAHGFVRNKSIVDNAKLHTGSKYVYNIDLKDFFPSVDQARVWKCLQLKPFYLNDSKAPQEIKLNEKAFILPIDQSKDGIETTSKTLRFKYSGYRYSTGSWELKLKAGGNIHYKIERVSSKISMGIITVFKEKSSFENIVELAADSAAKNSQDPNSVLERLIALLIEYHQEKLYDRQSGLKLANIIASLCCTEMEVERKNDTGEWEKEKRNVLPQGAPTSPVITNIICQRLDYLLTGVAKRFGLNYSRYADDITFSSMHNVYQPEGDFIKELHRIIGEQGFHIKESKTRLQKDGYRKEVTGLLVNEKVNVQQRYIKQLRMWLYYWERYGYERACVFFLQQYVADKGHVKKSKPNMASVIEGKLNYLKMVKGEDSEMYLRLGKRFNLLANKKDFVTEILSLWEKEGIEKAMESYYQNEY